MSFPEKCAKKLADFVYKNFETKGSGVMILLTSMTGIALSSLAQTGAILLNSKYTTSQKAFMVPQELTEGCITIFSLLLITTPLQKIAKKAVSTGKIRSKELSEYMKKNNLFNKRSSPDFDFSARVNNIIEDIKKSDKFIKSSKEQQTLLLKEHNDILNNYNVFDDMTSAVATTAGSIFSTALVSPIIRNYTASYYQKINIDAYNNMPQDLKDRHKRIINKSMPPFRQNHSFYKPCKI